MLIYNVVITEPIKQTIREQALLIAEDKPIAALHWYKHIFNKIHSLQQWPERCPLAPETQYLDLNIHHLIIGNYRVLFFIQEHDVVISGFKSS